MSEQLPLEQDYSPDPNFQQYDNWILTVGELKEQLRCRSDDTLIRISARGKTLFGDRINVTLPIESIGNAGLIDYNGEERNLIYLCGVGYPQKGTKE